MERWFMDGAEESLLEEMGEWKDGSWMEQRNLYWSRWVNGKMVHGWSRGISGAFRISKEGGPNF